MSLDNSHSFTAEAQRTQRKNGNPNLTSKNYFVAPAIVVFELFPLLLLPLCPLKIDPGPSNQATGFLELSNASVVKAFENLRRIK